MGPLLTLFSNPLPTPLLTRPLKNYFYRHFGVSDLWRTEIVVQILEELPGILLESFWTISPRE